MYQRSSRQTVAAAGIALLLTACSSLPRSAHGDPPPTTPTPDLAARIDPYFAPLAATSDVSGTLRVERNGQAVLVRHYGYADWSARRPHSEATRYSAASVTKGILAATLVRLAREGTLSLDEPVGRWLPPLKARSDMTLRAVLRHRAGLPRDLPEDYDAGQSNLAAWLAAHPEQLQPAGEERYSNVGYALLADVVAKAAGAPFADVAQRRVLAPAGMRDSVIRLGTAKDLDRGARPYTAGPGPDGVMTPIPSPLEIGSSGLITTAPDLARWVRTLADGAYPELFEGDDPLGSIDAGSDDNGAYVSVQGTLPGYSANAIAWRDSDLTISYTGNLFSYPVLDLGDTLRALAGNHPPPPPQPRPSAVPLDQTHRALAGQYMHPQFGTIAIEHDPARGGMRLTMPGQPAYWSFYLTPVAEGRLHWRAFGIVFDSDGAGLRSFVAGDNAEDGMLVVPVSPGS